MITLTVSLKSYPLAPGKCYRWEIVLDNYDITQNDLNGTVITVGVASPEKIEEDGESYYNGVVFNVTTRIISHLWTRIYFQESDPFKTGDVVGICFDMTHSCAKSDSMLKSLSTRFKQCVDDCGASIQVYKNRVSIGDPIKCIAGQAFFPTVHILGCQQITLRPWI